MHEAIWWQIYSTPSQRPPLISVRNISELLSLQSVHCFVGSLDWLTTDKEYFSYNIRPRYKDKLKDVLLDIRSKFGVAHWRRGDQLFSRCRLNHPVTGHNVFDFSVNCGTVTEFIHSLRSIKASYNYPGRFTDHQHHRV